MPLKPHAFAILEGVVQEMRQDPYMTFIYQSRKPVATGLNGEILDPAGEFGPPRAGEPMAINEDWYVGAAAGMSMTGVRSIVRMPSMASFIAAELIFNQVGKLRSMTGGQANFPLVVWFDGAARRGGSAGQHTDVGMEAVYAWMPGLKILVPSNAYDAKGLMITAIRDPDPVFVFDYSEVASMPPVDVPDEPYTIPIGEMAVRQRGTDLTLVAWAPASVDVAKALPELDKAGISVEYLDPRTLKPFPAEPIAESVRKTGKLLVVDHGHYTNGFGSHVIAEIAQRVPGARFRKLAFPDAPGPGASEMIDWMRPDAPKIVEAARRLVGR